MKKIRVIMKRPDSVPYVTKISPTLKNLQNLVGGYIETVSADVNGKPVTAIVNEEGILRGLPYNCEWYGTVSFYGTVIWCGVEGEDFADIPVSLAEFRELNPEMWSKS